jgi:hypothetical protein
VDKQPARAGPDHPALLGLIPQPIRRLRGQVQGTPSVADPLDELDGGLAAPGDGRELVKDEVASSPRLGLRRVA